MKLFATHIKVPGDHWNKLKRQARSCQLTIYLHLLIANSKLDYQIDQQFETLVNSSLSAGLLTRLAARLPTSDYY